MSPLKRMLIRGVMAALLCIFSIVAGGMAEDVKPLPAVVAGIFVVINAVLIFVIAVFGEKHE